VGVADAVGGRLVDRQHEVVRPLRREPERFRLDPDEATHRAQVVQRERERPGAVRRRQRQWVREGGTEAPLQRVLRGDAVGPAGGERVP
jgi:hypothetical protein